MNSSWTRFAIALVLVFASTGFAVSDSPSFVGAKKCRACHMKQFQSWNRRGWRSPSSC